MAARWRHKHFDQIIKIYLKTKKEIKMKLILPTIFILMIYLIKLANENIVYFDTINLVNQFKSIYLF